MLEVYSLSYVMVHFFCNLLEKGNVEVWIDGKPKKTLGSGISIGDLALLYNQPRSASIKCLDECFFWYIDRTTFTKSVQQIVI